MPGTISRYYPPVDGLGMGRFAHLHGNRETLLEPVDAESDGQVDFRCPECDDRASIVFASGSAAKQAEHAHRMAAESRRWGRDREGAYWDSLADDASGADRPGAPRPESDPDVTTETDGS